MHPTIGNLIVYTAEPEQLNKSAANFNMNDPYNRAIIGAGVGSLISGISGSLSPEMAFLDKQDKARKMLVSILKGGIYGGGLGAASSLVPAFDLAGQEG